jgi:hypothetical protein
MDVPILVQALISFLKTNRVYKHPLQLSHPILLAREFVFLYKLQV